MCGSSRTWRREYGIGSDMKLGRAARTFVQGFRLCCAIHPHCGMHMYLGQPRTCVVRPQYYDEPGGVLCSLCVDRDPRVMWHANKRLLDHVRLNGPSFHVVEYNAETVDDLGV